MDENLIPQMNKDRVYIIRDDNGYVAFANDFLFVLEAAREYVDEHYSDFVNANQILLRIDMIIQHLKLD